MVSSERNGKGRALEAAMALFTEADLTDVTAFIGMKQVARAVPVSPGTMTYYFGSREVLVREVVDHVLERFLDAWSFEVVDEALGRLARGEGDLADVAHSVADLVAQLSPGPDTSEPADPQRELAASFGVAEALLAAVAPNDPEAAATVAAVAAARRARYAELTAVLMGITGRRWRPSARPERLVVLTQALAEGFLHVRRYDPESAPVEIFADGLLRLYLSLTTDVTDLSADAVDTLHARFSKEPLGDGQEVLLERAVLAAQHVYVRQGWNGLTITAVAEDLGVDRVAVVRIFGDRRGLAAAVWANRVPALRRVAKSLGETTSVTDVVRIFLEELVDQARRDMPLSVALLEGVFVATLAGASPSAPESLDPKKLVPLPDILAELLEDRRDQLALDDVPGGLTPFDAAALLCNTALHLAFTRPDWAEQRVVDVVMATTFAGMRRSA